MAKTPAAAAAKSGSINTFTELEFNFSVYVSVYVTNSFVCGLPLTVAVSAPSGGSPGGGTIFPPGTPAAMSDTRAPISAPVFPGLHMSPSLDTVSSPPPADGGKWTCTLKTTAPMPAPMLAVTPMLTVTPMLAMTPMLAAPAPSFSATCRRRSGETVVLGVFALQEHLLAAMPRPAQKV